jgi:chromosome segregation ATPase
MTFDEFSKTGMADLLIYINRLESELAEANRDRDTWIERGQKSWEELAQYKALHANQKEYIATLQQQNHELLKKVKHETCGIITPAVPNEPSASN